METAQLSNTRLLSLSTRDIAEELYRCYGIEASPTFISAVTDSINDDVEQWRNRPLEDMYVVVFCDGFHLKVREEGKGDYQVPLRRHGGR